jgi:hypothetical protein
MLVTDLNHFLDLSEDTPGPARRLAGHLSTGRSENLGICEAGVRAIPAVQRRAANADGCEAIICATPARPARRLAGHRNGVTCLRVICT